MVRNLLLVKLRQFINLLQVELLAVAGHFCLFVQTTDQKFKLKNMIQELEKWNLQPCQTIQKGLYVVVRYGSEL